MSLRNIQLVEGLPFKLPPIEDVTDQLHRHSTKQWKMRNAEDVNRIVVHHMASEAPLINQAKFHVNSNGWPGLGYHMCVSEGRLKQTNDLLSETFHSASNNHDTVSISIHGDLSKRELRSDERELLYAGILTLKSLFPNAEVLAHSEVNATSCPCTSISVIREDIARIELQMKAAEDPKIAMRKIYVATHQHEYLYRQYAADPVGQKWLEDPLLKLYDVMKERGLFFGSE